MILVLLQVLELMKEVTEDDEDSSDISGYHSDSDSAIMMSGNSPYVSKRARYNFLTRSGMGLRHGARRGAGLCRRLGCTGGTRARRGAVRRGVAGAGSPRGRGPAGPPGRSSP